MNLIHLVFTDNTFRFCTDYRKVNSVTKPDSFPLHGWKMRGQSCASKFVSKLDLLKGYWQVPLTARACEISAFVTSDDFLQYNCMAFGMRNAPATFQRLMQKVLLGLPNCEAYLDDIVVYSDVWKDHICSLEKLFTRLSDAQLTLNLAKCEFAKSVVTYLGKRLVRVVSSLLKQKCLLLLNSLHPAPSVSYADFWEWRGTIEDFVRTLQQLCHPLLICLALQRTLCGPECDRAFFAAKDLLCYSPVLSAPNFSLTFKLQVDASAVGAGAVLLQEDRAGIEHPVCYFPRSFQSLNRTIVPSRRKFWH